MERIKSALVGVGVAITSGVLVVGGLGFLGYVLWTEIIT